MGFKKDGKATSFGVVPPPKEVVQEPKVEVKAEEPAKEQK